MLSSRKTVQACPPTLRWLARVAIALEDNQTALQLQRQLQACTYDSLMCESDEVLMQSALRAAICIVQRDFNQLPAQQLLCRLKLRNPEQKRLALVPNWDVSGAVHALRYGADSVLTWPASNGALARSLNALCSDKRVI